MADETTTGAAAGASVPTGDVASGAPASPSNAAPPAAPENPTDAAPVDAGPLAPRFAALARKEKELTLREKKVKDDAAAREAALVAREKEVEARLAQAGSVEDLKRLAKEQPTEFFKQTGLTMGDLTSAVLKEGEAPTPDDRIAKLEASIAADKKAAEEAEAKRKADSESQSKAEEERIVSDHKAAIADFVTKNAEKYELVAAEGASDLVFDLIEAHYQKTAKAGKPEIMPVERASELAEAYLFEDAKRKYSGSKKLGGLFVQAAPVAPPAPEKPAAPPPIPKRPAPTITGKASSSGASPSTEKTRLLTPFEIAAKHRQKRA